MNMGRSDCGPPESEYAPHKKRKRDDYMDATLRKPTRLASPAAGRSSAMKIKQEQEHEAECKPSPSKKRAANEEKRLRRFRTHPPLSYTTYYQRAMTQRMFVLDRIRLPATDCPHNHASCPCETIALAGTTGNIYTVTITHQPSCTCPYFLKGNPQCKHIVYALVKVLKAPEDLAYQLAFLTSELETIFATAGPLPSATVAGSEDSGRRHDTDGDCAICCEALEGEELVWCRDGCGNNLHASCFGMWAATKKGGIVTCPYCRKPWEKAGTDLKGLIESGEIGHEGYVNVAAELGISGEREWDSYHPAWVRRHRRRYW